MDHQHAPQSVWVRVDRSPACPACGTQPIPPLSPKAGADIAAIISQYRRATRPPSGIIPGQQAMTNAFHPAGAGGVMQAGCQARLEDNRDREGERADTKGAAEACAPGPRLFGKNDTGQDQHGDHVHQPEGNQTAIRTHQQASG